MADESQGDKTEAATPRRRQEAREEGNIARSADLSSAALLVSAMLMLRFYGLKVVWALWAMMKEMLSAASLADTNPSHLSLSLTRSVSGVAMSLLPLIAGTVVIVVAANLAQTGLIFSTARITPNIAALNPTRGFSRLFSQGQGLVKLAMSLLKMSLVAAMAYSALHGRIKLIILAQQLDFMQIFAAAAEIIFQIAIRIGVLLLVLSIIDYAWQKYRYEQQLKMTKQEVKDEMKSMEGDPQMKLRRRQIALARLKEKLKHEVPRADVVVTNPTEFAIAIQYDPNNMNAPRVIAKGQGHIAARIREIAIENGIPILERKPLARALYKLCDVGQEVPEQFFSAVAEILAYVYELNGKFKQKHFAKAA